MPPYICKFMIYMFLITLKDDNLIDLFVERFKCEGRIHCDRKTKQNKHEL